MGFPGSAILVSAEKTTHGLVAILPAPAASANLACSSMRTVPWGGTTSAAVRPWHTCGANEIEQAVKEIEAYVAADGWDGSVHVFSLVDAEAAMTVNSILATGPPASVTGLLSIKQEGLPSSGSIDEPLGRLTWSDTVDGTAVSPERMTLPLKAEVEIPDDTEGAWRLVAADPRREDIRMVVGVLRNGESWCTIRLRSYDSQAEAISDVDLIPEMVEVLLAAFTE